MVSITVLHMQRLLHSPSVFIVFCFGFDNRIWQRLCSSTIDDGLRSLLKDTWTK